MSRALRLGLFVLVLLAVGCPVPVEQAEWGWTRHLRMADGSPLSIKGSQPEPVMLVFWSDWATPCEPMLEAVQEFAGRVRICTVLMEAAEAPPGHVPFEVCIPLVPASDTAAEALGVEVLPTVVVFDLDGAEVGRVQGYSSNAVEEIRSMLAGLEERQNGGEE